MGFFVSVFWNGRNSIFKLHTNIKHIKKHLGLSSFCLWSRNVENNSKRIRAGQSKCRPLASLWITHQCWEYSSVWVLPYIHVKSHWNKLGLEVTILKQTKTLSLKLCLKVLWVNFNQCVKTSGQGELMLVPFVHILTMWCHVSTWSTQ